MEKLIFKKQKEAIQKTMSAKPLKVLKSKDPRQKAFYASITSILSSKYIAEAEAGDLYAITNNLDIPTINSRTEAWVGNKNGGARGSDVADKILLEKTNNLKNIFLTSIDNAYWEAIDNLKEKDSESDGYGEERGFYDFLKKHPSVKHYQTPKIKIIDKKFISEIAKEISAEFKRNKKTRTLISLIFEKKDKYMTNSENSEIYLSDNMLRMYFDIDVLTKKREIMKFVKTIELSQKYELDNIEDKYDEISRYAKEIIKQKISIAEQIANSPWIEHDRYPVIMNGYIHGIYWHEVIGHALEGDNVLEDGFGASQSQHIHSVNKLMFPEFITLIDDPTKKNYRGSYEYDDELVKSKKVLLIENGIVKDFLHSRKSAGYFNKTSNGHGRAEGTNIPEARMSNLELISRKTVNYEDMEKQLVETLKKEKKNYGIIFEGEEGSGWTMPDMALHNIVPETAILINKEGKKSYVKGAYIAGTELVSASNLLLTADDKKVFSGTCGSASGWIPVTSTSPSGLYSKMEINCFDKSELQKIRKSIIKHT
ncbi:hypothetical protein K9L97_05645 [Candidatus Woesearchaeota archaeon]|nr:hypothetical protein [Candidatus Woesearchaeota archaeon]